MTQIQRSALKVVSILVIVVAVISALVGIIAFAYAGSGDPTTTQSTSFDGVSATYGEGAALIGIFGIISGIVDFIVGCLGVRGANNPSKIGAFWVIALIGVIFEVVEFVLALVSLWAGTATLHTVGSGLISLAVVCTVFVLANNIKKQAA